MYSILGRGSFCFNYCLNSAWHGGDQFVALLRWYGSPGFFDTKMCQSNYLQNECCSITRRRAVMSELHLVKVQCVTVNLLKNVHNKH